MASMRQTRAGFLRALKWFKQEYEGKEGVVSIEQGTVTSRRGNHWFYAVLVKVKPGSNLKMPKLWNGFNVVVVQGGKLVIRAPHEHNHRDYDAEGRPL